MVVTQNFVKVAVAAMIDSINPDSSREFAMAIEPVKYPLAFSSIDEQMAIILWECLLYNSKWTAIVKQHCKDKYLNVIRYGLMSMSITPCDYSGGGLCNQKFLCSLSTSDIAEMFNINTRIPETVQPGIEILKPGPLTPFVQWIHDTMKSYSEKHGSTPCSVLLESIAKESQLSAMEFVKKTCKAFASTANSEDCIFQSAVMLCFGLYQHFKDKFPHLYDFEDIKNLPLIVDVETALFLHRWNVISNCEDVVACNQVSPLLLELSNRNGVEWYRFIISHQN